MQKTVFIYFLQDPLNPVKGYVGKAKNPRKRFSEHLCSKDSCRRGNWIRALRAKNLRPSLEVLDEVLQTEWQSWEAAYIEFFREQGFELVNGTNGGDGVENVGENNPMFGKKTSAETRAKQSKSHTGKERSPEHCLNSSIAKLGAKNPMFGKTPTPEHCAIVSATHLNKKKPFNKSGFVGVFWDKRDEFWRAEISVSGKPTSLGYFRKLEDAVFVRNLAFDKFYGNS